MADTNVIETHEDQAPESQEHIQEMIDKAERVQSVPRNDGQPTWLPEKFESPEDLAEAYSQLEQKLSSRDTHQTENVEVKEPSSSPQNASINEVSEALGKQGIDFNKYAYEYAQNGTISDQSYGELEQQGLSQDVVDTWIAGQQAIADQTVAQAHEAVGGLDEYNSLLEWAGNALPEKEIDAFNRAIENPNVDDVVFTIKSLHARRMMEDGQAPTLLQGDTGGTKVGSFQSVAQLTKAMNDPRYQKDPAYRDEVTSKLSQSSIM
tara:strand:- start:2841 stop:3632 length:792 start_codon:yes stop_codon:yes gene_type:complete